MEKRLNHSTYKIIPKGYNKYKILAITGFNDNNFTYLNYLYLFRNYFLNN